MNEFFDFQKRLTGSNEAHYTRMFNATSANDH